MPELMDPEVIEQFERGEAPGGAFHHSDHVRMAFLYLQRYPFLQAAGRFSCALKRFAATQGKPKLYHETITWAYLVLIHERMARGGGHCSWEEFAAANPDLLVWRGGILQRVYREETLASELARAVFVLPDRCS